MSEGKHKLELTLPSEHEILMTRVFDAPIEMVFKAFTDPEAVPQWWGPRIYKTTVDKMDVRPGGAWRFIHSGPDGEYAFNGVYKEIVPPTRLVYTFEYEGMPGHILLETITLESLPNGQTKVNDHARFDNTEDRDGMLNSGMEWGATQSMDRLEEYLESKIQA